MGASRKWLLFLDGGGNCFSDGECRSRFGNYNALVDKPVNVSTANATLLARDLGGALDRASGFAALNYIDSQGLAGPAAPGGRLVVAGTSAGAAGVILHLGPDPAALRAGGPAPGAHLAAPSGGGRDRRGLRQGAAGGIGRQRGDRARPGARRGRRGGVAYAEALTSWLRYILAPRHPAAPPLADRKAIAP